MPQEPQDYISLLEAIKLKLFPSNPHKNSVTRWADRGCYGVKLKTIRYGGKRLTRPAWVAEFNAAIMGASPDPYADSPQESPANKRAEEKLDALGIK